MYYRLKMLLDIISFELQVVLTMSSISSCSFFLVLGRPHSYSQRERFEARAGVVSGGRAGGSQHDCHRISRGRKDSAHLPRKCERLHNPARTVPRACVQVRQAQEKAQFVQEARLAR